MEMTVKQMLGQKLIFGFHGTGLSEEFISLIKEYKIGNVILFLRNVVSVEQVRTLCRRIQELILAETGYEIDETLCNRAEDRAAVREMTRKAITNCAGSAPIANEKTFFCGCADYRAFGVGNEDAEAKTFVDYMKGAFGGAGIVTSKNPETAEIEAVAAEAAKYDQIILNTCNGHLFRGQIALAEVLAKTGKPLTVVALRNPYDLSAISDCKCKIAAYDYAGSTFTALEDIFRGGEMTGICPVAL